MRGCQRTKDSIPTTAPPERQIEELKAVVSAVGPPPRCLFSSIAWEAPCDLDVLPQGEGTSRGPLSLHNAIVRAYALRSRPSICNLRRR